MEAKTRLEAFFGCSLERCVAQGSEEKVSVEEAKDIPQEEELSELQEEDLPDEEDLDEEEGLSLVDYDDECEEEVSEESDIEEVIRRELQSKAARTSRSTTRTDGSSETQPKKSNPSSKSVSSK